MHRCRYYQPQTPPSTVTQTSATTVIQNPPPMIPRNLPLTRPGFKRDQTPSLNNVPHHAKSQLLDPSPSRKPNPVARATPPRHTRHFPALSPPLDYRLTRPASSSVCFSLAVETSCQRHRQKYRSQYCTPNPRIVLRGSVDGAFVR